MQSRPDSGFLLYSQTAVRAPRTIRIPLRKAFAAGKQRAAAQDAIRMQAFRGAFPACESGCKTRCQISPAGKNCCAKLLLALQ